jgi:DNA-binding LacI/PurR family transcriptional regulator
MPADSENLYINVKNKICDEIYRGNFREGERMPAERQLSDMLGISRVTLRKALEILTDEGLVSREVGNGNIVHLPNRGVHTDSDMIVLIAPAKNPFFSEFIQLFQRYGQEQNKMILYVEKPRGESLSDSIYRLFHKGLQNFIIWPEDIQPDMEKMKRLRALGANLVFFDSDLGIPYADCVTADNDDAIRQIRDLLQERNIKDVRYIGWDKDQMYSVRIREAAFQREIGGGIYVRLPWAESEKAENLLVEKIRRDAGSGNLPAAFLCGDRQCGELLTAALAGEQMTDAVMLACIDDFPQMTLFRSAAIRQDLDATVRCIFSRLSSQNQNGDKWKAMHRRVKGQLVCYHMDQTETKSF